MSEKFTSINEAWLGYENDVLESLWKSLKRHPSNDPVAEILREFFEATFYGGAAACFMLKKNGMADVHLKHQLESRAVQGMRDYPSVRDKNG